MFKAARWKSDKNKTKVVFKLQFQATQVPQIGWDTLMVSLIPVDVGKPTVRSEKALVRDGTCRWENPIYEAVKFIQEAKTGKFNEKVYKLIVSSGSSKSILGEVTIDFSDYAEAVKATSVSFPIKNSNSGAVLHVSVFSLSLDSHKKKLLGKQNLFVRSVFVNVLIDGSIKKTALSENAESNGNLVASRGFEATSTSGSESSSERNTPRELGLKILMNNNIHQDPTSFLSSLSRNSIPHKRSNTEWSVGSAPDGSTDDSTNSSEDNLTKERFPQASDLSVEKLKSDLVVLARQAEVSELELQTLRKQVVKESKKGQDLSREVVSLKDERDSLKKECEQLKASQKHIDVSSKLQFESEGLTTLLKELRQELNHEKDLNANLRLQLQKTQESNSELILAVQDLDEMLEKKNKEISHLSKKSATEEVKETVPNHDTGEDEEQKALEVLIKEHDHAKDAYLLEQKIVDLYSEIDVYRRDRDELEMQMEQLALDYEILKQENHDLFSKLEQNQLQYQLKTQYELDTQVENLEKEVKNQEEEFSASLATINELETQLTSLEKELEKQAQGFVADLEDVTRAKVEQEKRAILAEEALRKTRWANANTAERLQEEFRRLSMQMASTFDANEKLAMKAVEEANEIRLQKIHLEELLEKANEGIGLVKDQYEEKLKDLLDQIDLKKMQAEKMLLEVEDKSKKLENQQEHEEEIRETFSKEILMLRAEIERLREEKNELEELEEQKEKLRVEMELMKTSINETKTLVQTGTVEKDELERRIASARKEAEKSLEELNTMRSLKDEKETKVGILQSELETLRGQYNELRHSLVENELEKENLKKQVSHLRSDLQKKEDLLLEEIKLLEVIVQLDVVYGIRYSEQNNFGLKKKTVNSFDKYFIILILQIQLKESTLEKSSKSFLEKEKDLCNRIEELEKGMEELNLNNTHIREDQFQKVSSSSVMKLDYKYPIKHITFKEEVLKLNNEDKELMVSSCNGGQADLNEMLREMELLKRRNKSMEGELKDMQERYSEISLKFAEVEGERQQLVMTVRNLKNAKKI
ncbi:EEIG1/EHBP1 N-terminal domain [Macleaya cordata]|uniref:EEIG1/EHBP1 N-terminal domain n=1 Tax=Macleaya cordata TaxID=56857 RepID=A0A200QUC4_MACCD|nr:EEIG1/EHBP1 N-terminal domain [Macleaya cordata]